MKIRGKNEERLLRTGKSNHTQHVQKGPTILLHQTNQQNHGHHVRYMQAAGLRSQRLLLHGRDGRASTSRSDGACTTPTDNPRPRQVTVRQDNPILLTHNGRERMPSRMWASNLQDKTLYRRQKKKKRRFTIG